MPELKHCPFCGSMDVELDHGDTLAWVACLDCHADGPTTENGDDYASQLWNSRAEKASDQ